jgi:hypothetical protein
MQKALCVSTALESDLFDSFSALFHYNMTFEAYIKQYVYIFNCRLVYVITVHIESLMLVVYSFTV